MRKSRPTFVLAGGGPGGALAIQKHFRAALDAVGKSSPSVAYVGVASDDNAGFQRMLTGALSLATGARFHGVAIASPKASTTTAKGVLDDSDLVFVSGGDVDHGMNVLRRRGMLEHVRTLCRQGKPMFGVSAGSVMLGAEWVRFPDDDDDRAEIFECIGAVPFAVDAHSEDDDWSELRTLVRLMKQRGDDRPAGYGLTSGGALAVELEEHAARLTALGTDIPVLVTRAERVVRGEPIKRGATRPVPRKG